MIQPTVIFCNLEEQDLFFDSNKKLKEHCRYCHLCQKHELATMKEYRARFGLGSTKTKKIVVA